MKKLVVLILLCGCTTLSNIHSEYFKGSSAKIIDGVEALNTPAMNTTIKEAQK